LEGVAVCNPAFDQWKKVCMGLEWNGDPAEVRGPGDVYPIPPKPVQISVDSHPITVLDKEGVELQQASWNSV